MFRRFLGLNKFGGTGLKASVAARIVVCIWIYNVAFNIPMFIWSDARKGWSGGLKCFPKADAIYVLVARIINFFAPLIITWTSYVGIIYKLKLSMNKAFFYSLLITQRRIACIAKRYSEGKTHDC